jgi:teichuronic acid exporter
VKNSKSIIKDSIMLIIGKYSVVVITVIQTIIMSRLLSPEDFGVVAVVNIFASFFTLISNMGIGPAIIQNKSLDKIDLNSIFSVTVISGFLLGLVFIILSFPLSRFFSNESYIIIGYLLSISLFFNTINIVPASLKLKDKKFRLVAVRTTMITLISSIISIYLAYIGFSYFSIVINSILISILSFIWNMINSNLRIRLKINTSSIKKIFSFSINQYAFTIANYFSRNLDNILIARFISQVDLGYYNRSYSLMLYPVSNIAHAITPVLHPILSNYEDQKIKMYSKYVKLIQFISIIGVFVTVFSFIASREIILIFFGNQWVNSIESFKFLSISIWPQLLISTSGSIYQSLNKTKLLLYAGLFGIFTNILLISFSIFSKDINVVALFVSISQYLIFFHGFYILITHAFNIKYKYFLKLFVIDFYNFTILFIIMTTLSSYFTIDNIYTSAIIKLIISILIYLIILIFSRQIKFLFVFFKRIERSKL